VTDFRPEAILAILTAHQVQYVMIGGLAAALHGSDMVTTDLDITPEASQENLTHLSAALSTLHARIRTDDIAAGLPFAHDARSLAASNVWNLTTDFGDLDISFVPSGTTGFRDLTQNAIVIDVLGTQTRVASLPDIIRSKEAAGRPKDQIAVPVLRRLLAEIQRREAH
jgi:hypothetical protein